MQIHLVDILVSLVLGLVMFGVGLSLTAREFKNIIKRPKELTIALCGQLIALPIIAFILTLLHPSMLPEFKTGFIILAASPGGATAGLIAYLFRGNVALSLSITTVNSFLTLFSIPLVVNIALGYFMGNQTDLILPFWDTVVHIFSITLIPASLGIILRHYQTDLADKMEKPARYVMLALLLIVFIVKIFAGEKQGGTSLGLSDFVMVLPHALVQNAACLFFGYFLMKYIGAPQPSRITAAIESGVQNTTLSFLIAGTLIGNQQMVIPPLIYSMFSFVTACIFCYSANKLAGQHPPTNM
jgi:BASS family bile acid:Na+ symporter